MGRRKERRLAAMSAAGRRVKLDLFAEPTEEMNLKHPKDEDTGDPEQEHHSGVPSSPSTSGHEKQNPLFLLGQYSDDETNDDLTSEEKIKGEELGTDETKENGKTVVNETAERCIDIKRIRDELSFDHDHSEKEIPIQDAADHDTMTTACESSLSEASTAHVSTDGWKVLVDEQTGKYYYWNTITGETSWEIPSTISCDNGFIAHDISQSSENRDSAGVLGLSYANAFATHSYESVRTNKPEDIGYINSEAAEFGPDHLLKLGEAMIQRLKALERLHEDSERKEWRLKCTQEVEMRLSDCKSLSSYGSALLPFWWHTNSELKKISDELDLEEFSVQEIPNAMTTSIPQSDACILKETADSPKSGSSQDSHSKVVEDNSSKDANPSMSKSFEEDVDMDVEMEVEEEDWIPPPPPQEEDAIPPPPTEEPPPEPGPPPPEPGLPPCELGPLPLLPYSEQYPVPYVTAVDYYNPSAYYAEPQQVAVANGEVSLATPIVYYDVPVPAPAPPVVGGSESSSIYTVKVDAVKTSSSSKIESSGTSVSAPILPDVPADTKPPPKASRVKKRSVAVVPTMRSNKKVSSLVDKWKAAKEELHGDDEDEPEDPLELLERKRQREIEQWKSRQIASGEAQENANFLPLGGDWREKVKRRRAEANAQSSPADEEAVKEKKQSDVAQFSNGLPSGWKVYWDETSKKVYYSNTRTGETTWIRPSS